MQGSTITEGFGETAQVEPASQSPAPVLDADPGDELERLRRENAHLRELVDRQEARIAWMQEIGAALGTYRNQHDLLGFMIERISRIMDAERTTLFILEPESGELWSRFVSNQTVREIRVRLGEGIAGWVARHGVTVNVKDAYRDPRFKREFDRQTGFRTRSVLCQPMRNKEGRIIGVVQALNKRCGWFSVDDERLLTSIMNLAAIVIENQTLYLSEISRNVELMETKLELEERVAELDALYQLQRTLLEVEDPFDGGLEDIARACLRIVPSAACGVAFREEADEDMALFMLENTGAHGRLSAHERLEDFALGQWVMRGRETKICNDLSCLPPDKFLAQLSVRPRNLLAAPLRADGNAIGVLYLVNRGPSNKAERGGFSDADRKLLSLAAAQVGLGLGRILRRKREREEDRLSTIGRMLSGVLHDLKTPLTIVNGYVQLMARSDDANTRNEFAEAVLKQFDHLDRMTREVLAYARGDSALFLRNVILRDFVNEFRELLAEEFAGHPIDVQVTSDTDGEVRFDDGKIRRILFNLARNAREAMEGGGHYEVHFTRDGEDLVVSCADTGAGIPPEIRDQLFDAFVTSGKASSTGLGLAIVRKFVEDHGGRIHFASTPGEGTTFHVRLPVFRRDADGTIAA